MDIAAVWVHVNTHAQHLNIVAITEVQHAWPWPPAAPYAYAPGW